MILTISLAALPAIHFAALWRLAGAKTHAAMLRNPLLTYADWLFMVFNALLQPLAHAWYLIIPLLLVAPVVYLHKRWIAESTDGKTLFLPLTKPFTLVHVIYTLIQASLVIVFFLQPSSMYTRTSTMVMCLILLAYWAFHVHNIWNVSGRTFAKKAEFWPVLLGIILTLLKLVAP